MTKGVLLYTCYNSYNNTKYHTPTDEELKAILQATDEILLIPIVTFNRFTDENGNDYHVLDEDVINGLTADMVGDPSRLETIRGEYHATANFRLPANYHVKDYVNDACETAKRLVKQSPNVKLWFSVPSAENFHALTHHFAKAWSDTVKLIKATVPEDIWQNNVQGIYYAGEDIVTAGYTVFDTEAPEQNFRNPIVYSMRAVSDTVHGFGKKMLWIPYYHEASSSSDNLGYVANLTDIFDHVVIQPSFFFNSARTEEIGIVSSSVKKQAVLDINGEIIGGRKTSSTEIGFEMEIDHQFYEKEDYPPRYYAYEKGFGEHVDKHSVFYYAGTPETLVRSADIIKKFYGN